MTAPCRGCPDRHECCWSDCPKYKEYREERDRINKLKREEKGIDAIQAARIASVRRAKALKKKRGGM